MAFNFGYGTRGKGTKTLRCKRPSDAETKIAEPVVCGEPVAVRRAEEDRREEPGPSAHDTVITVSALDPRRAVRRRAAVVVVVAIHRPLPDIAYHIVESVKTVRPPNLSVKMPSGMLTAAAKKGSIDGQDEHLGGAEVVPLNQKTGEPPNVRK